MTLLQNISYETRGWKQDCDSHTGRQNCSETQKSHQKKRNTSDLRIVYRNQVFQEAAAVGSLQDDRIVYKLKHCIIRRDHHNSDLMFCVQMFQEAAAVGTLHF
jgi:hypothetical protein